MSRGNCVYFSTYRMLLNIVKQSKEKLNTIIHDAVAIRLLFQQFKLNFCIFHTEWYKKTLYNYKISQKDRHTQVFKFRKSNEFMIKKKIDEKRMKE